jgi:hypothetical protein
MSNAYPILMIVLLVLAGIVGVVLRLARIGGGRSSPLSAVAALIGFGVMLVVVIYVAIQFHNVGNAVGGPGSGYPNSGGYTPVPFNTGPSFSTPPPGLGG